MAAAKVSTAVEKDKGKPATVRVLHRAVDSDDEGGSQHSQSGSPQQSMQELKAANDSLKQRLEQAKASAAAEKKKLADELRLERAGRERAEEVLVRQAKELEACAAAKARLEEAFSRSMSELRYTRAENAQAKLTNNQLIRELMLLRDAISRSQGTSSSRSSNPAGPSANGGSGRGSNTDASGGGGSPMAASTSKQMSKGQLLSELHAMRSRMAEEQSRRKEAEAEKERAEESQEMISRQTAKLLDDRAALLSDLSSKDDVVRELQATIDHVHHQLDIALNDRHLLLLQSHLLLEQLRTLAGDVAAPELAALTAAMESGYSQDLDELEAFAHGQYNGELHGSLGGICSPRGSRQLQDSMLGLRLGGEGSPAASPAASAKSPAGQ